MSVILKCGLDICRANTNTSTAKQMYTFSKAARFPPDKTFGHSQEFYDLPSTLSKRYTKMGYGNKSDFTLTDKNYKAELYDKGSDFNPQKPYGPKYSFPNGREKYGKVYLDSVKLFDKDVPGPGKYNYLKPFGSNAPKYTFRGRNEGAEKKKNENAKDDKGDNENKEQNDKNEKPYITNNPLQINVQGKYPLSSVRNVNSMRMGNDKTKRSDYIINKNPGPADYTIKPLLGRIFESPYRSSEGVSILSRYKVIDSRSNYPGPGSYRLPSDFGQYESKDADKYPKENVYVDESKKKGDEDPRPWRHGMKVIKEKPAEEEPAENNENDNNQEENNQEENKEENKDENNNNEENKEEEKKDEENKEEEKKDEENKEEEKKDEEKKDEEKKDEEKMLLADILKQEPVYDDDEEENAQGGENANGEQKAEA